MQHEHHRVPVTAVAQWKQRLVLAGAGNYVQAYEVATALPLQFIPVFTEQAVHGILIVDIVEQECAVVVWGGNLLRQLHLTTRPDDSSRVQYEAGEIATAQDWILDAAIEPTRARHIAIVTAHNALTIATREPPSMHLNLQVVVPGSNCILYCAQVTWLSPSSCLIASGTAFGDIIVWSCELSEQNGLLTATHQTHYTFSAHDGSVFGLHVFSMESADDANSQRRILASCSDDRTIRLWDITDLASKSASLAESQRETGFGSGLTNDTAAPVCLAKMMGHISRIWHVKYVATTLPPRLLSFGEDATCITWTVRERSDQTIELHQTHVQRAHSGKHIWSAAVDGPRNHEVPGHIVTGGADGAIAITEIIDNSHDIVRKLQPGASTAASFRSYSFISKSEVVAITDDGTIELLLLDDSQKFSRKQTLATNVDQLCGYSTISSSGDLAFFAGKGQIYYYVQGDTQHHVLTSGDEKVASLFGNCLVGDDSSNDEASHSLLVTTIKSKSATWLQLSRDGNCGLAVARSCALALPAGFIVTSFAMLAGSYLALGSRTGCVAIFALSPCHDSTVDAVLPLTVILGVHGIEAVTALQYCSGTLYSCGRDGTFAAHRVGFSQEPDSEKASNVEWSTVHQLTLPFGPNIEGLHLTDYGRLWVWGFRGKQFVVFDVSTQHEVMAAECGGAHRSFAFHPGTNGGTFLWTKASELFYQHQEQLPYRLLNSGGHGREIKATAISPSNPSLVATGAEDTNIKLQLLQNGTWKCLHTLQKHITGIQHLQWSTDGTYLFSSGGVEEFYIWKITPDLPVLTLGVVCESAYPHSTTSDLRIMNFDVQGSDDDGFEITMVYSNSTVQKWHYRDRTWTRMASGEYLTACLTQCLRLTLSPAYQPLTSKHYDHYLLTASTDGHLVTWTEENNDSPLTWHTRHKVHQSAILSLVSHVHSSSSQFLISGGDDNGVGITEIFSHPTATPTLHSGSNADQRRAAPQTQTLLIPSAHAAAITALAVLHSTENSFWFVSAGLDQRVKVWRVEVGSTNPSTSASTATSPLKGEGEDGNKDVEDEEEKGQDGDKAVADEGGEREGMDGINITLQQNLHSSVADVSSIDVMDMDKNKREKKVLICGVGMEVFRLDVEGMIDVGSGR